MDPFVTFLFGRRIRFVYGSLGSETVTVDDAVVSRRPLAFLRPGRRPHVFKVVDQAGRSRTISLRLCAALWEWQKSRVELRVDGHHWADLPSFIRVSRLLACGGCGYTLHDLHSDGEVLPCPECGHPHRAEYIREVHRTMANLSNADRT